MNRTIRTRLATAAVLAPLALGLVACGDDDNDDAATSAQSATDDSNDTSDDMTDDTTDDGATDGGIAPAVEGDVETAAQTALAAVNGTVFSVDWDDMGWDVTVVTSDGVENDVQLSPDASSVEGSPVEDTDQDNDDAAEIERLLGVSVDYAAAVEAASAESQGTVTGVDLSEDNGTAVWEVQFDEDTPDALTVDIDAESGDVLRTEVDD